MCSCGARGCWEAEIGDAAIIRAVGRDPRESDIEDVLNDVAVGNRRSISGVRKTGEWVGLGLASLVNLFNPRVVVLGGTLGALYPTMEPTLAASYSRALGPIREQALLVRSDLGSDAQLVGAAEVAFADVLEDPAGTLRGRADQEPELLSGHLTTRHSAPKQTSARSHRQPSACHHRRCTRAAAYAR